MSGDGEIEAEMKALRRACLAARWDFVASPPDVGDSYEVHDDPDAGKGVGVVSYRRVVNALDKARGPWAARLRVEDANEGPIETYSRRAWVTGVADATGPLDEVVGFYVALAAAQYAREPNGIPGSIMAAIAFRRAYAAGGRSETQAWDIYLTVAESNRKHPWADWSDLVENLLMPAAGWELAKSILSSAAQILIRYELGYTGYTYDRPDFTRRAVDGDPAMTEAFRRLESTIDWHLQAAIEGAMPPLCGESSASVCAIQPLRKPRSRDNGARSGRNAVLFRES